MAELTDWGCLNCKRNSIKITFINTSICNFRLHNLRIEEFLYLFFSRILVSQYYFCAFCTYVLWGHFVTKNTF